MGRENNTLLTSWVFLHQKCAKKNYKLEKLVLLLLALRKFLARGGDFITSVEKPAKAPLAGFRRLNLRFMQVCTR